MVAPSDILLVKHHLMTFFEGHECREFQWQAGPMTKEAPWFRILRFSPGPRYNLYSFVSLGASALRNEDGGLEFAIFSEYDSPRFVELLTMTAHYHKSQCLGIGIGHTVPVGGPWVQGATCNHYLVSLPYPLGPEFEVALVNESHIHILWLLPITEKERDFKIQHGLEALESQFDEKAIDYSDFGRESVI